MNKNNLDYEEAKIKEDYYYPIISEYFQLENLRRTNKYHKFDYINDKYLIELKCRKIKSDTYDKLFFNYDKLIYGISQKKDMILIFEYIDKILYINFDKEKFLNYDVKRINNRNDRGKAEYINCIFIPLKDMKEMIINKTK
jgi:hypothetical protein